MHDAAAQPLSLRQRGCGTFFFGFFFLLGCLFTGFMLFAAYRIGVSHTWDRAECEILESEGRVREGVADDEAPYELVVRYRYQWQGREETSGVYSLGGATFTDWTKIHRLTERYPVGARVACYVDPEEPSRAVLEKQSLWILLALPLPLLFVGIGAVGFWAMWFGGGRAGDKVKSISAKASGVRGNWVALAVFGIFALAGLGILIGLFLGPAKRMAASRSWEAVPCTVEFSRVGTHRGDDSTTYSVDVLYSYEYGGRRYRSSRYRHFDASSSGYADKRDVVSELVPGTETTCYVDPDAPENAVMVRTFEPIMLIALLPVVFLLIGVIGIRSQWGKVRRRTVGGIPAPKFRPGPVRLDAKIGRWGKLLGAVFFALFWNGVVSVFSYQVFREWQRGRTEWFLILFLVPFVLVGLGAVVAVFYYLLALFNPRPALTLSQAVLQPGSAATLQWAIEGRAGAVRRLEIVLEGTEQITVRRGKSSSVKKHQFHKSQVYESGEGMVMERGSATVRVPRDAMHSFESGSTKVVWALRVSGAVDRWPDVDAEYPVQVFPAPASLMSGDDGEAAEPVTVSSGGLVLTIGRSAYGAGGVVEGTASWELAAAPKSVSARLFWYLERAGSENAQIVAEEVFGTPGQGGRRTFRLTLPEVPHSYAGKQFSIRWAVELVAQSPEAVARAGIRVG